MCHVQVHAVLMMPEGDFLWYHQSKTGFERSVTVCCAYCGAVGEHGVDSCVVLPCSPEMTRKHASPSADCSALALHTDGGKKATGTPTVLVV